MKKPTAKLTSVNKSKILFSTVFTFLLPISVLIFPLLAIIFNIIYFPFTLIHELGHFIAIALFLPALDPQLKFNFFYGEFCCACEVTNEFPQCWQTIIIMLAGSLSVITAVIVVSIVFFRISSGIFFDIGKYYLTFGLLADLPNLLPILPSSLGSVTDGYAISTCLYQMGYSFFISNILSQVFSLISIFMVLSSFFFLGLFLCSLGQFILVKVSPIQTDTLV